MQEKESGYHEINKIKEQLLSLEKRLFRVEDSLENIKNQDKVSSRNASSQTEQDLEINLPFKTRTSIEFSIGEYGMAWLGNIVLLFAIVFFAQNIHNEGKPALSILVGYVSVTGIYIVSYFTQKQYPYLSKLFRFNSHLLLFYLTLRLHYVESPLVENQIVGIVAIMVVLSTLFYFASKNKSRLFSGIVLLMALVAGIISNSTYFLLSITTLTAMAGIWLYYRFGWIKLVIFFILFVYLTQLMWLLNNPIITHQAEFHETHDFSFIYLVLTGFVFSLPAILPQKENISDEILIFSLIWNGLGFTSLLILTVFTYLNDNYALVFALIAFFSLLYAVLIKSRSKLKISASIYAVYGFMAMSVAIYGIFLLPKSYMLFALQSFAVVSVALWFRSQFIVVANTLLFLVLLVFYIKDPVNYHSSNFAFLGVAFITARVINWKKERLNLKTEFLRNIYLIAGFVMTLIAFYHVVPKSLITVSWIIVGIVFFVVSYLLKNTKYRWLAIAALIASTVHLVAADMSSTGKTIRILVFLLLAIISIVVSVFYTKYIAKKKEHEK